MGNLWGNLMKVIFKKLFKLIKECLGIERERDNNENIETIYETDYFYKVLQLAEEGKQ